MMRKMYIYLCLSMVLFSSCMPVHHRKARGRSMSNVMIKVGLSFNKNKLVIKPNGDYDVYSNKKIKGQLSSGESYTCGIYKGSRVVIAKMKVLDTFIYLKGKTGNETISIDNKKYRGNLYIKVLKGKNKFLAINELNLEYYLYGVVPREVSSTWPAEAIKAQAVAARTYALKNSRRHKKDGYDVCDSVHCQVYGGIEAERAQSTKAIDITRGEIIAYHDRLADIFYHSCCGGYTENVINVWNTPTPIPYLHGRRASFCKKSRFYDWEKFISFNDIEKRLKRTGYKVGDISKAKIKSFTRSGRVKKIAFLCKKDSLSISGTQFRKAMGNTYLKSTKFKIYDKKDGIKIIGHGHGHGIGLCQSGAKTMAEKKYSYKKILNFYFPGTDIALWDRISD